MRLYKKQNEEGIYYDIANSDEERINRFKKKLGFSIEPIK